MTENNIPITIPKPKQWDTVFDSHMLAEDVERLLTIQPFKTMDPASFPPTTQLFDILLNESRIMRLKKGEVVFRQGDYGSSAFLILSGKINYSFNLSDESLGRKDVNKKSIVNIIKQIWDKPKLAEVRDIDEYWNKNDLAYHHGSDSNARIVLQDVPAAAQGNKTQQLAAGGFFGEVSAMTRSPRTATMFAAERSEILEIKWQGFRDLMRYSKELRQQIETLYRQRSLKTHLAALPIFSSLPEEHLDIVVKHTLFETYGSFDWYTSFKMNKQQSTPSQTTALIDKEPVIAEEGHYADGLILIRSGFARVSKKYNHGHNTISYITKGDFFGLDTVIDNIKNKGNTPHRLSLRALGYTDVLRVPTGVMEKIVLPNVPQSIIDKYVKPKSINPANTDDGIKLSELTSLLESFVERRFINGTKTMLINLERCTGCDDCVTACANAHDNNPRFIRHGHRLGKFMVANSCMHCSDPVCMIGCPTGAIHRNESGGQVIIHDSICIGCGTCANSCPYSNIRMVNIRSKKGDLILDEQFNPILKATKCDLCAEQMVTPSCENACPNDALKRVDINNIDKLRKWIEG